jgi:hypothetical protein
LWVRNALHSMLAPDSQTQSVCGFIIANDSARRPGQRSTMRL